VSNVSVMILCGNSPRHLYVANRLCRAARPVAIVQEMGSQLNVKKVIKVLRPDNAWRKIWRWLRDRRRYIGHGEANFFFGDETPRLDREDLVVQVSHINHPKVVQLADEHHPDVIAVFGTSLIRGALLEKGRLGIINMHGGLSPEYRGADCTFWALYNGEPEKVGCSLHFIDAGIDSGNLLAHVCPEIRPGDDELTLFWRAVKDGAEVYAEVFSRLEQGNHLGEAQSSRGRLYQVKDRCWRHERALAMRLKQGALDDVELPQRVRWFGKRESVSDFQGPP